MPDDPKPPPDPQPRLKSTAEFWQELFDNGYTQEQRRAMLDSLPPITTVPSPTRPPQE